MIKRKPSIKDWWYTKHRIYARIRSERIHDPELHEVEQTWKYHFVRYVHVNLEYCLISCILRKVIEIEIRTARMELAVKNNWLNFLKIIEGALTEKRSTKMTHCAARSSAINSIEDFCQSKAFLAIFSKDAWGKRPQLMIVRLANRRDAQRAKIVEKVHKPPLGL